MGLWVPTDIMTILWEKRGPCCEDLTKEVWGREREQGAQILDCQHLGIWGPEKERRTFRKKERHKARRPEMLQSAMESCKAMSEEPCQLF